MALGCSTYYSNFFPLYMVGVLLAPVVAIAEFFSLKLKRGLSLLSSARVAIVSAAYSVLFFLPYLMHKFKDKSCFSDGRAAVYVGIHLYWLFGVSMLWIYSLANTGFDNLLDFSGRYLIHYPQRSNEEIITSVAIIVLLLTCIYSALYLWRAHRAGMIRGFAIAPFVLALAWSYIGNEDCNAYECTLDTYSCANLRPDELEYQGAGTFYYWALPLILASVAWIGYTSIRLWRARPGVQPPAAAAPETRTPPSSRSSPSNPATPRTTPPDTEPRDS